MKATVALPTYRCREILWLQLESLCRQDTGFTWELLLCEEDSEAYAGPRYVDRFAERLWRAGCRRIEHLTPPAHVLLPEKWRLLAAASSQTAAFLLCASDNFSPACRIERSTLAMLDGDDWYDWSSGHFYDITTGRGALWRRPVFAAGPGLFMAIATKNARLLPPTTRKAGVDGWLKRSMPLPHVSERAPGPAGLHTDGRNLISDYRASMYNDAAIRAPFYEPEQDLEAIVPAKIARKLRMMTKGHIV